MADNLGGDLTSKIFDRYKEVHENNSKLILSNDQIQEKLNEFN